MCSLLNATFTFVLVLVALTVQHCRGYAVTPFEKMGVRICQSKLTTRRNYAEPVESLWFPTTRRELDLVSQSSEDGGSIGVDHPGFNDPSYRQRRRMIADKAFEYRHGDKLPYVEYTESEHETWRVLYKNLREASLKYAIPQYNDIISEMEQSFHFAERIPQLQEVSDYLEGKSGWSMRPVSGLLPSRGFLAGLALKVFHSSQYLRHGSRPFYTPEPDIVHEYIGHAPLLADPDFAALSQEIGLASLGASDEQVKALASCYWFSVEFGLCRAANDRAVKLGASARERVKAYGAGVLSSLDEMLHACEPSSRLHGTPASVGGGGGGASAGPPPSMTPPPELRAWRPSEAAHTPYPITTLQPRYYVAPSLAAAKSRIRDYCRRGLARPFAVTFDESRGMVVTDRTVWRAAPPCAAAPPT